MKPASLSDVLPLLDESSVVENITLSCLYFVHWTKYIVLKGMMGCDAISVKYLGNVEYSSEAQTLSMLLLPRKHVSFDSQEGYDMSSKHHVRG